MSDCVTIDDLRATIERLSAENAALKAKYEALDTADKAFTEMLAPEDEPRYELSREEKLIAAHQLCVDQAARIAELESGLVQVGWYQEEHWFQRMEGNIHPAEDDDGRLWHPVYLLAASTQKAAKQ